MYFTDRGIEELEDRRGEDQVTLAWLAERLRDFIDLIPDFEVAVDRLATWLARLDDEDDLLRTFRERTAVRAAGRMAVRAGVERARRRAHAVEAGPAAGAGRKPQAPRRGSRSRGHLGVHGRRSGSRRGWIRRGACSRDMS